MKRAEEAGYILFEAVVLGLIVLAAAAVLAVFARTALLEEQTAARAGAAFLARERFSVMEAALDTGRPFGTETVFLRNDISYEVETEIHRTEVFYDVTLRISWNLYGRTESSVFVRRLRRHNEQQESP